MYIPVVEAGFVPLANWIVITYNIKVAKSYDYLSICSQLVNFRLWITVGIVIQVRLFSNQKSTILSNPPGSLFALRLLHLVVKCIPGS